MKRVLILLSAGGLLLMAAASAQAQFFFASDPTGTWLNGPIGTTGTQFKVGATPVRVTALGFFDDSALDGLAASHIVAIYDMAQHELAEVTVKSGTASALYNGTRWESLYGYLDLSPNTSYMLAFTQNTTDKWNLAAGASQVTLDSRFTLGNTGRTFVSGAGLNYPGTAATDGKYSFGGNIQFTSVPEPQTWVMSGVVLSGAGVYGIRRRRATVT